MPVLILTTHVAAQQEDKALTAALASDAVLKSDLFSTTNVSGVMSAATALGTGISVEEHTSGIESTQSDTSAVPTLSTRVSGTDDRI